MDFITNFVHEYGLVAIFVIIMLEYACFPVSSEIVLPFSGAVASGNHTNYFVVLGLSILAGLIGTGICFAIGWFGGGAILQGLTRRFPKTKKPIDAAHDKFKEYGPSAVCIGRVIPLIRTYIAFIAGSAKMNPLTYFGASLIGISIWNTLLIGLGYILQENYQRVGQYYEKYKSNLNPIFLICAVALVINFFFKRRKRKAMPE